MSQWYVMLKVQLRGELEYFLFQLPTHYQSLVRIAIAPMSMNPYNFKGLIVVSISNMHDRATRMTSQSGHAVYQNVFVPFLDKIAIQINSFQFHPLQVSQGWYLLAWISPDFQRSIFWDLFITQLQVAVVFERSVNDKHG